MKKIIRYVSVACFCVILLSNVKIIAQPGEWEYRSPLYPLDSVADIQVFSENEVMVFFSGNKVGKTDDGGQNWTIYETGNEILLNAIQSTQFVNDSTGWISLYYDLLKTTDGGKSWEWVNNQKYSVEHAFFLDAELGWAVIDGQEIMKSTDGGVTWSDTLNTPEDNLLGSLFFSDSEHGWLVGTTDQFIGPRQNNTSYIARTTDGGQTWSVEHFDKALSEVFFINNNVGWARGLFGEILSTTDGGQNWEVTNLELSFGDRILDFHFLDENKGWLVGSEGMIKYTEDGGLTWTLLSKGKSNRFNKVHFIDEKIGWVTGRSITLATNNGGKTWEKQTPGSHFEINGAHFYDDDVAWLVGQNSSGDGALMMYYEFNESRWTEWSTENIDDDVLHDIQLIDKGTGWAVGEKGTILYMDASNFPIWQEQSSEVTERLNAVYFLNKDTGWAVGDNGTIVMTTDGGVNWLQQMSGTDANLHDICFSDSHSGWITGMSGSILHSGDGGQTWDTQDSGTLEDLHGLHCHTSEEVWSVGSSGKILQTSDAGTTWIAQESESQQTLYDIVVLESDFIWISGGGGTILFYDGDADGWVAHDTGSSSDFRFIQFNDIGRGWSGTADGELMRYTIPPLESPLTYYPANTSLDNPVDIELVWYSVPEAPYYHLQVWKQSDSSKFVINEMNITDTTFALTELDHDTQYRWRVRSQRSVDEGVIRSWPAARLFTTIKQTTSIEEGVPGEYKLHHNYPNPFNPTTVINYQLPVSSNVRLEVFDILGRRVAVLVNEQVTAGSHTVQFDASNLASGVYIYRMSTPGFNKTRQMTVVK